MLNQTPEDIYSYSKELEKIYDEIQIKTPQNDNQIFFVWEEPINIDIFNKTLAMDEGINPYKFYQDIKKKISQEEFDKKLNKTV